MSLGRLPALIPEIDLELIRGKHNLRPEHRGSAVTIGNFDGLHLGHRPVLGGLIEAARARGLPPVVISFEHMPPL